MRIVIEDGARPGPTADGGIDWIREIDGEKLSRLGGLVAVDGDIDGLGEIARIEGQSAVGRHIIRRRRSRTIGGGEIHTDDQIAGGRKRDRKGHCLSATVAFRDRDIVNGNPGLSVYHLSTCERPAAGQEVRIAAVIGSDRMRAGGQR